MSEILTESFCERCGTRYTFESGAPGRSVLGNVRVVSKGLRTFATSRHTTFSEAMADARGQVMLSATTQQLDAFHSAFNFCLGCRQYTCRECWNEEDGRCRTCSPFPADLIENARREAARASMPEARFAPAAPVIPMSPFDAELAETEALLDVRDHEPAAPPAAAPQPRPAIAGLPPGVSLEQALASYEATLEAADEAPEADAIVEAPPVVEAGPEVEAPASPVAFDIAPAAAPPEPEAETAAFGEPEAVPAFEPEAETVADVEVEAAAQADAAPITDAAAASAAAPAEPEPQWPSPRAEPVPEEPVPPIAVASTVELPVSAPGHAEPAPVWPAPREIPAETPPEVAAAARAPAPVEEAPGAPATVETQPVWPAPRPIPADVAPPIPQPSTPPLDPNAWQVVAPEQDATPRWPTARPWPLVHREARPARGAEPSTTVPDPAIIAASAAAAEVAAMWAASAQQVLSGGAATSPTGDLDRARADANSAAAPHPCDRCGLALSATARFCRRCGMPQP